MTLARTAPVRPLPALRSALLLALLLAFGAALLPPAAGPLAPLIPGVQVPVAAASGGIAVTTATRYVVDPGAAAVHATVDLTARNVTPDSVVAGGIAQHYFDGVNLGLQPEAVAIRATQDGAGISVQTALRSGYRLATLVLRSRLFYGQTAVVHLAFDLPAGAPRSASDVRVGRASATFVAWAFGDSGTVRIEIPAAFTTDITGARMQAATVGTTQVFSATASDAVAWYAWVNARNDAGLSSDRLEIPGGEVIIVRGWPEDATWRQRVGTLLTSSVPQLVSRIGLPWPVAGPLNILEIPTKLLEGYGGFYNPARDEITISEDLDALTIVHEASHAWFNSGLFDERWINEGLANEYASRVLVALGEKVDGPGIASLGDPAAFRLNTWPPPTVISDSAAAAREKWGYDASWTLIRTVVGSAGETGMRRVFQAAHDGTTAYPGAGAPERATLPADWRRFLDLAEGPGGATGVAALLQAWALPADSAAELTARADARAAYAGLLAASRGLAAPWAVRQPLDAWTFDVAGARIAEAGRIVAQLAATDALAASVGLTPPPVLDTSYETAGDQAGLDAADALAGTTRTSLDAVAAAVRAAGAPRDWLISLGLLGGDPDADLAAARQAWEAGDAATAGGRASLAASELAAAPDTGRTRVIVGGGVVAVLLLLLLLATRRRRRSRRDLAPAGPLAVGVAPAPAAEGLDSVADGPDLYATLPPSESPEAPFEAPTVPRPDEEQGAEPS